MHGLSVIDRQKTVAPVLYHPFLQGHSHCYIQYSVHHKSIDNFDNNHYSSKFKWLIFSYPFLEMNGLRYVILIISSIFLYHPLQGILYICVEYTISHNAFLYTNHFLKNYFQTLILRTIFKILGMLFLVLSFAESL